jgi:hypothetical protein
LAVGIRYERAAEGLAKKVIIVTGSEKMIIIVVSEVVILVEERVTARDDDGWGGKVPFELVEPGDERVSEDEVVVDKGQAGPRKCNDCIEGEPHRYARGRGSGRSR